MATQKEVVATWAAENGYEIVGEVIDRSPTALPAICHFEVGGKSLQHATRRGDALYVLKLDTHAWRQWRRSDTALGFPKLSKNQGDRAVFVTAELETASYMTWRLLIARWDHCMVVHDRVRIAAARLRKQS